jgi:hypothetical protein
MAVPYAFANATTTQNLSSLDANFNYFGNAITVQATSTAMTIDSSGNVGIGTSSPAWVLDISSVQSNMRLTSTTGTNNTLYRAVNTGGTFYSGLENSTGSSFGTAYSGVMWHSGAYPLVFGTSNTERMRIDSSGNLLVGKTSNANNIAGLNIYNSGSNGRIDFVNTAGSAQYACAFYYSGTTTIVGTITTQSGSTTYATASDYRLKENVTPMTNGLTTIGSLKPVTYDWIGDKSKGEGFIAHELQAVIPLAVTGEKDAAEIVEIKDDEGNVTGTEERIKPQGVDYSKIVVHLVAALQEAVAKIDALETRIATLETK